MRCQGSPALVSGEPELLARCRAQCPAEMKGMSSLLASDASVISFSRGIATAMTEVLKHRRASDDPTHLCLGSLEATTATCSA